MQRVIPIPAVVASLAPRTLEDAKRLLSLVPARATAVEYRLDLAEAPIRPRALLELDARPVIATYRSLQEGGSFDGSADEYRRLTTEAYEAGATVDIEHGRGILSDRTAFPRRERVVASRHSPFALPEDYREHLAAMLATGSRAVKLVAGAGDLPASFRIAALQKGQPAAVTIFPMGPASPPGRVLSALFGAALVYGPVERDTAGGQLPVEDLLDVYEVDRPRAIDALFGVVGGAPKGSLSPVLYNALFRSRGLAHLYVPLPVADFDRESPYTIASTPSLRGLAVTQPWKLAAARAGRPSEDVAITGAANTLVLGRGGWRAENTDVDGVFDPLADHDTGEGRYGLVLGAGGAARAAVVAARRLGYEVAIAARRDSEADRVADELGVDSVAWADVASSEADLYLNATPVGWKDEDPPAIPPSLFEARPLVFDCVYRRDGRETSTIRAARAAGCPTVDGLRMLAAQAVRQASLFGLRDVTLDEVSGILRAGARP